MGQYKPIVDSFRDELDNYFEECEVVATEEKLYEDIEGEDMKFKGYIDLVVKTPDGKYHILDWKTCSWGWDARRRPTRSSTTNLPIQVFWAKKHGVPLDMVETHFGLLQANR